MGPSIPYPDSLASWGGDRDGGGRDREGERWGIGLSVPHPDPLASWERGEIGTEGAGREKGRGGE